MTPARALGPAQGAVMKNFVRLLLVSSLLLASLWPGRASAKWYPVHHIESDTPLAIADGDTGKWYKPDLGYSMSSWQETTRQAFSHAVGLAGGNLYEFRLISVGSNDSDS